MVVECLCLCGGLWVCWHFVCLWWLWLALCGACGLRYCDLVCLLLFTICFLDVLISIVLLLELVCMAFRCFVVLLFDGCSCSVVNVCLCWQLPFGVGIVWFVFA